MVARSIGVMKRVHQRVVKFMPQISVGALDRHIFNLRRKLADDTHEPRFIEIVAGHGYRFHGPPRNVVKAGT